MTITEILANPVPGPTTATSRDAGQQGHDGYAELRLLATMFQRVQVFRIAMSNLVRSYYPAGVPDSPTSRKLKDPASFTAALDLYEKAEQLLKEALTASFEQVVSPEIRQWVAETPGIGEHSVALLLGIIGHPIHARPMTWVGTGKDRTLVELEPFDRTVGQLRAYCGYGDPQRRRRAGMSADEAFAMGNPAAKKVLHIMAESATIKKFNSPYRAVYEAARAAVEPREDWTDGHKHAHALRVTIKAILKDLWRAAASEQAPSPNGKH